jgi:hypothetical protein
MTQIFVGLITEGTTDIDFLLPIIEKTFNKVAFQCKGQIDVEIFPIEISKINLGFIEQVITASKKGFDDFGMTVLCVQADADTKNLENTYEYKIKPAKVELEKQNGKAYCKNLVAIVPIQETEAWMLADKELLKSEIGTDKTDTELNIHRQPESVANPKEIIENAIRIARADLTKKKRANLSIGDLYIPIGTEIDLEKLETLSSYQAFQENVHEAFRKMNLLL